MKHCILRDFHTAWAFSFVKPQAKTKRADFKRSGLERSTQKSINLCDKTVKKSAKTNEGQKASRRQKLRRDWAVFVLQKCGLKAGLHQSKPIRRRFRTRASRFRNRLCVTRGLLQRVIWKSICVQNIAKIIGRLTFAQSKRAHQAYNIIGVAKQKNMVRAFLSAQS